jgi:hypothetical protein
MKKIFKKIYYFYKKNFVLDVNSQKFINHNKNMINMPDKFGTKNKVLFEFTNNKALITAYSYFAQVINKDCQYEMLTYKLFEESKVFNFLQKIIKPSIPKEYASFGIFKNINLINNYSIKKKAKHLYEKKIKILDKKKDIEKIKIDGILIGDLLYDAYLKINKKPTLNIGDENFNNFSIKFIELFLFWKNYIFNNDIKFIICNHTVYESALTIRIAFKKKNCKCFQVTQESVFQLTEKNKFAYKQFEVFDYKKLFKKLNIEDQKKFKKLSSERIKLRFNGVVGVDMGYSTKSGYGSLIYKKKVLKKSPKIKILIATHDFLDNPHAYSKNIFPDFYEWMKYLCEFSKNNKYDWYVKCHPDFRPESLSILKSLLNNYPNIKFINPSTSHHQIIKEGINIVFTMYGTIGWEYPYLGVPCINATYNNPRFRYKFNINPRNLVEYKKIVNNLAKFIKKISKEQKNEILEFYYMNYIYFQNRSNWLIDDFDDMFKKLGGYRNRKYSVTKSAFYKYWLENFNLQKHNRIINNLDNFIKSNKYFLLSRK